MNIVVAYRKSHLSSRVLERAIEQARTLKGTIHLVTSFSGNLTQHARELENARKVLDEAVDTVEREGISCEAHLLLKGLSSGEDIVAYAREIEAAMIIIGVEKKSKVGKFLMGSTAQHVVTHADCPVYTVK